MSELTRIEMSLEGFAAPLVAFIDLEEAEAQKLMAEVFSAEKVKLLLAESIKKKVPRAIEQYVDRKVESFLRDKRAELDELIESEVEAAKQRLVLVLAERLVA